jgi:hypothetical protein
MFKVRDKMRNEETSEKCDASLSLPLTEGIAEFIKACPKCRQSWLGQLGVNEGYINAFAAALVNLKGQVSTLGFRLYLEIAPDVKK